jgi:hypothetical protein
VTRTTRLAGTIEKGDGGFPTDSGIQFLPVTRRYPMCCCGCGAELTDSLYWATEICHIRWLSQQARLEPPTVRTYCGATYTEQVVRDD